MLNIKKIENGTAIIPKATSESDSAGELEVISTNSNKLTYHNGVSPSPVVTEAHSATLTNKTINGPDNTITNIGNASIATGIDAVKIADGSVTNTEFQYINTVTSNVQTQLDSKASDTDLTNHIADTTTHGTTGNIVGTSDSQILTNKTINGPDNTVTNIGTSSISSISASKITSTALRAIVTDGAGVLTPSSTTTAQIGYLSTTTSDVQVQIDAKASTSSLTAHTGTGTNVHGIGASADVVGTTTSQTLTNKTIDGCNVDNSLIRTPVRLDVKKDTAANLATYAAAAGGIEGQLCYSTDTKVLYNIVANALVSIATGAAGDLTVVAVTANYTVLATDGFVSANANSGAITLTLPTAAGITGRVISFMKTDASLNKVIIDGSGSETINGDLTRVLATQYAVCRIISDGTNWKVLVQNVPIAARGVNTGGQVIGTGSNTQMVTDATDTFDPYTALASTGLFTAPETGYYSVTATCLFQSSAWTAGQASYLILYKNGSPLSVSGNNEIARTATQVVSRSLSDVVFLAKGDTTAIYILHNRGSNTTLGTSAADNYLSIVRHQ